MPPPNGGKLRARDELATPPGDSSGELPIAQHARQGPRPGLGVERRHEHARVAGGDQVGVAAGIRCDDRQSERHRLEQGDGQPFDTRWQGRHRGEATEGERTVRERHVHHAMVRRNCPLDALELGIGFNSDARDDHRPLEGGESPQQDVLVLATRQHQDNGPPGQVAQRGARGRHVLLGWRGVHSRELDPVRDDAEAPSGIQAAAQRAGHRVTHRNGAVGGEAHGEQLGRRGQGHGVSSHDKRASQAPPPPQPGERPTVTGSMAVYHIDALACHQRVQLPR